MSSAQFLNASDAAYRLGISPKALRLYEQRGLVSPVRTAAGWRIYGPEQMARAAEIAALRALGLSLAQVARLLGGDAQSLAPLLAAHQSALEAEGRRLSQTVEILRGLRTTLAQGSAPAVADLERLLLRPARGAGLALALPWPWGGEHFQLREIRPLTYITGPLGCGKTRLAQAIAAVMPGAQFLGLQRLTDEGADAHARMQADPALRARVQQILAWLVDEGATASAALTILLVALEADDAGARVIDMVEQDLDEASQEALMAHLRGRGADARPLFLLTRSRAILDLAAVGRDETILLCPANHSPPQPVAPYPGSPGYEAVATCLASAEVRARTAGVIARRPAVA